MTINVRLRPQIGTDGDGNPVYGPSYMSMGCASVVQDTVDAVAPLRLFKPVTRVVEVTLTGATPNVSLNVAGPYDIIVAERELDGSPNPLVPVYQSAGYDSATGPKIRVNAAGLVTHKSNTPDGLYTFTFIVRLNPDPDKEDTYELESITVLDPVTGLVRPINPLRKDSGGDPIQIRIDPATGLQVASGGILVNVPDESVVSRDGRITVTLDSTEADDEKELDKLRGGSKGLVEVQDTRTCTKWYPNAMIESKSVTPTPPTIVADGETSEDTNYYVISIQLGEPEFLPELMSMAGTPRASFQVSGEGLSFDVGALPDDC